jgi:hypothetical protein
MEQFVLPSLRLLSRLIKFGPTTNGLPQSFRHQISLDLLWNKIAGLIRGIHAVKTAIHRRHDEQSILLSSDNPAIRGIENHGKSD